MIITSTHKLLFVLLFCFFSGALSAQICDTSNKFLFENFDSFSVSNDPPGWIVEGCDYFLAGFPANSLPNRLGMNNLADSIIAKGVVCPSNVSFNWRASGASSNFTVRIQYSTDLTTWTTLDSVHTTGTGSPTTYQNKSITIPFAGLQPPFLVYIRWNLVRRVGGTFYLDDVCMTQGVCHANATELRFGNYTSNCVPSGLPFSVSVCATDANGYIDTTFSSSVVLSLAGGSGTLSNATSNAVAGCAQYNSISFSGTAPLSLAANSGGLSSNANLTSLDIQSTCPNVDTLSVVTYNLLNFPLGGVYALGGACSVQELGPNRWDTLKTIMQYMKPDILIVQELQTEAGADSVLYKSLNVNGASNYARAPYIPNKSTANTKYNNELFYNTNKLVLYQTTTIGTSIRDCGVYKLYCKDPQLSVHLDTTFIDMYSIHTKAKGLSAAQATLDSIQRAGDCQLVMDTIRLRQTTDRNAIIGGDMNLYTSAEGAYQNFTTGLYRFNDPINTPGAWESNPAFAITHSQAARSSSRPSLECGARGGLDSRLDFLLATDPIISGTKRMQYIANTYNAMGNSGNLFNKSVDTSTNTSSVPANVLRSLANMSDHLPVQMLLEVNYPTINPLALGERAHLLAALNKNQVLLNWEIILSQDFDHAELLCDNKVVYKFTDASEAGYAHMQPTNGMHQYKLRNYTKQGALVMSNTATVTQSQIISYAVGPNPFTKSLTVHYNQAEMLGTTKYTLTNMFGTVLLQGQLPQNTTGDLVVETSNLPTGCYAITFTNRQSSTSYKLLKL
jgi:hypothetical protein